MFVEGAVHDAHLRAFVPWARGDEGGGDGGVWVGGIEDVAGELFFDESGVGLVVVEGLDEVVAIGPGIGARFVFVVAVGFGEVDGVDPVLGPALAVARGGQETVYYLFIGVGRSVGEEGGDFFGSGGEACEIVGDAADEGAGVGFFGGG